MKRDNGSMQGLYLLRELIELSQNVTRNTFFFSWLDFISNEGDTLQKDLSTRDRDPNKRHDCGSVSSNVLVDYHYPSESGS